MTSTVLITIRMVLCAAAFSLLILWSSAAGSSGAVVRRSIKARGNSNKTVDGSCPSSCGNLTFAYPFGIGLDCSRGGDFSLICHDGNARQSPRLFLRDGITEVVDSIEVNIAGWYLNSIVVSIWRGIRMNSSVRVYNMSLETPGGSFSFDTTAKLSVTGCDLDVYWISQMTSMSEFGCSTWCPGPGGEEIITEEAARYNCSGMGCCSVLVQDGFQTSIQLSFVHRRNSSSIGASRSSNRTSLLWERITVVTSTLLFWNIVDQPNCASVNESLTGYACMSRHSQCNNDTKTTFGYTCKCEQGFTGNAYIIDGCTDDDNIGYNPKGNRANCTRRCGNIDVPFPFGIENGCFAMEHFRLFCTDATSSAILHLAKIYEWVITSLEVNEAILNYTEQSSSMDLSAPGLNLFDSYGLTSSSMQWVVANLRCAQAEQNTSSYACVSINSRCVEVNTSRGYYLGYRCKCIDGFQGNPYIHSGCQDIDECLQQDICNGRLCSNIERSFKCTECPRKTVYDHANNRCTRTKQQTLLIGIIIGLSGGFSILLLSFVAFFLFRRWKRNAQKQLRRNYFHKNQGLLLEQLISPDRTNIFSLEELEKATNNFDPTRIIGHGGHGMVFKGILSDQRVVAIKKSLVIEYSEIRQFINEVAILSEINHRNIVKLFGCCLESEVPLLVYDYISNGSLSQIIHAESPNDVPLSWDDYIRIAAEAAGALSYLHSAASISVFHRDVKSSNILLDGNYTAKVSDFGASRLVPVDQTHIVTNVQGTFGYLDPEYFYTRQLNEKSDVYSFGVVLLELLVRKKPVFTSNSDLVQNLSNYFLEALKDKKITDIVDSQVVEEATKEEISSIASLAEMCLRLRGEERPTMKQVEMELQILRKKRLSSYQSGLENEQQNLTMLLARRAEATYQAFAIQPGSSLEKEFMESATLPR